MLAIVIVNYKNEDKTISYIKEELIKVSHPHIIIIVNNLATNDSNIKLVEQLNGELILDINEINNKDKKVYILPHAENLGFAKGNNYGAQFSINHFKIDYLLFSNNDIRLTSNNVVEELIAKLNNMPDIGIIGPKIIGLNGERQSPEPYSTLQDRYIWMLWLTPFMSAQKKEKRFKLNYPEKAKEGKHYKVMGSFFLIRSTDFEKCGMMDPNTFLFSEEIILTERLKSINKHVYYYPEVEILHEHGQTISNHINHKKKAMMKFNSECYYYKTYKGVSQFQILMARISYNLYFFVKNVLRL